ncbi:MAG: hypothetical protein HRU15_11045 [Planctomycetes bacterium]|nr:hypothetical protein [Planctomycetota bacterium]
MRHGILLLLVLVLGACNGSGSDGGGDKNVFINVSAPKTISSNLARIVIITPTGLSLTEPHSTAVFTVNSGPGQIQDKQSGNEFDLMFPLVGTYNITVDVKNRRRYASATFSIEVLGTGFTIDGNVNDDGLAQSGVTVDLIWLSTSQQLSSTSSDGSGDFQFGGLIGTIEDYQIDVQGTP